MIYAADTSVSVEKTRAELETLIRKFGAESFGYVVDQSTAGIQFKARGKFIRFILPLPSRQAQEFTHSSLGERSTEVAHRIWEQACRSAWRALFLIVKAKMIAVESGIVTFDSEFMAQIVLPNGRTAGEEILPQINDAYKTGKIPSFILALPEQ